MLSKETKEYFRAISRDMRVLEADLRGSYSLSVEVMQIIGATLDSLDEATNEAQAQKARADKLADALAVATNRKSSGKFSKPKARGGGRFR